jgi:phage terminase small subunit
MYVGRDEALKIVKITTRQGLSKFVKKHNIRTERECNGKPTFYNKEDLLKAYAESYANKTKYNPTLEKKSIDIQKKKEKIAEERVAKKKEAMLKSGKVLDEIGQSELIRVEKELKNFGIYRESDRSLLLSYAIAYSNYIYYTTLSRSLDHTSIDMGGNQKVSHYLAVADKFFSQMDKMASKLGIGAKSRVGLEIKKEKKVSVFDIINTKEEL